jgi:hypothetical protein
VGDISLIDASIRWLEVKTKPIKKEKEGHNELDQENKHETDAEEMARLMRTATLALSGISRLYSTAPGVTQPTTRRLSAVEQIEEPAQTPETLASISNPDSG